MRSMLGIFDSDLVVVVVVAVVVVVDDDASLAINRSLLGVDDVDVRVGVPIDVRVDDNDGVDACDCD